MFDHGSRWTDDNLFNGEYYIQKVTPVKEMAPGLPVSGLKRHGKPDFQIGEGCWWTNWSDKIWRWFAGSVTWLNRKIPKALQSIVKYNSVHWFSISFNNMRSYAMGNESGLMLTV